MLARVLPGAYIVSLALDVGDLRWLSSLYSEAVAPKLAVETWPDFGQRRRMIWGLPLGIALMVKVMKKLRN
jgi:hypothetical protein